MANIINGSFEESEPGYIISNEIKFLEKFQETKCYNSNVLIVFFSPVIAIIIGKFISLLNIIGIILLSLLRDRENIIEIIKLVYENILTPAMNAPETIIEQYPKFWSDLIKIINDYVDIYFYIIINYWICRFCAYFHKDFCTRTFATVNRLRNPIGYGIGLGCVKTARIRNITAAGSNIVPF